MADRPYPGALDEGKPPYTADATAAEPRAARLAGDRPHGAVADEKGAEMRFIPTRTQAFGAAIAAVAAVAPAAFAQDLRSPDARAAGQQATPAAQDPRSADARVAVQPATPAADDLRSADARVPQRFDPIAAVPQAPPVDVPSTPSGFDWVSAGVGAAAGAALLLVAVTAISLLGIAGRRRGTLGLRS
jgi:hypothetical protein